MKQALDSSFSPVYARLYRELVAKISSGQWKPGEQLPTERQLAQENQLSVGTVRKAMELLVQAGYCYRIQGKGTFISDYASSQTKFFYKSRHSLFDKDVDILPREVAVEEVRLPDDVAGYLNCDPQSRGIQVRRTLLGRDENGMFPLAWCVSYFPYARASALLDIPSDDFVKYPLYIILEKACHLSTVFCDEFLQICTELPARVQEALGRPRHTVCFEMSMVSYTFGKIPFEFRLSYMLNESTGMIRRHDFRQ